MTDSQRFRFSLLFDKYLKIKQACDLSQPLRTIFSKTKDKGVAYAKLARRYNLVEKVGLKPLRFEIPDLRKKISLLNLLHLTSIISLSIFHVRIVSNTI